MASFFTGLFRTWAPSSSDHEGVESSSNNKMKGAPFSSSPPSSPLAFVFKLMDLNGDGLLSVQEMSQSFHKLGVDLSPPLLNSLLCSFPLSHPGFLQFHEFEAFYASICKDQDDPFMLDAFPCENHSFHDTLDASFHDGIHSANPNEPHSYHDGGIHGTPPNPCEPHSCHHYIHGPNPCVDDDDDHCSSTSCDDDDICSSAGSWDDDLGSANSLDDHVHHNHILPSSSDGSSHQGDVHMCRDDNYDDDDLLEAFHIFDKNADGFISMPELQSVMCNLGFLQCQDDSFCRGILQSVDSNGDGLVDFTEFKHMMESSHLV